jgi:hypothetical protein
MNFAGAVILLLAVAAGVFGIYLVAGNANSTPYQDTYGSVPSEHTNLTQSNVTSLTTTAGAFGGGLMILIALLVLIVIATFASMVLKGGRTSVGRR